MNLVAYLNFNGNCKEALELYKKALNGNVVEIHHYLENPEMCKTLPDTWHNKIMHASFHAGEIFFMAADVMAENNNQFNYEASPISLSLNFTSETQQTEVFNQLSDGSTITMPLQNTFWGARFGMLKDKFGIKWMFNYDKNS